MSISWTHFKAISITNYTKDTVIICIIDFLYIHVCNFVKHCYSLTTPAVTRTLNNSSNTIQVEHDAFMCRGKILNTSGPSSNKHWLKTPQSSLKIRVDLTNNYYYFVDGGERGLESLMQVTFMICLKNNTCVSIF